MRYLSSSVSKKTGLAKSECEGIIKVVMFEIIQGLIDQGFIEVEGLGTVYKTHNDEVGGIMVTPTVEVASRLNAPRNKEKANEIVFE